ATAAAAAAVAGGVTFMEMRSEQVTCRMSPEPFRQVWGAERRAALHQAFVASGRANAEEAFGLFSGRLDAFRSAWLQMKQEACEATHLRGEQSERVLALRN